MGSFLNASVAARQLSLVDLCLPGTHDSLSYDLSLTVSDDGLDNMEKLANLLHTLSGGTIKLLPQDMEEFFRLQAKTQQLTIAQQLDNGIRFVDCRIMMEKDGHEWRSIHFMQSKQTVDVYWREIRDWLDRHPQEIVVLWLSKHGSVSATGDDQYPGVSIPDKLKIWQQYLEIFDGLLLNTTESSIHKSTLADLISRNHRVVTYATDHVEFTNSSELALDAKNIQNYYALDGVFDLKTTRAKNHAYFEAAAANNAYRKEIGGFALMSMNTAGPVWQLEDAAKVRFLPLIASTKGCAAKVNLPGVTDWCPETLLDIVQLSSYYNQMQLEQVFVGKTRAAFPHAFYLDGLDFNGTIRTGSQLLDGAPRGDVEHQNVKYAYVDTVIAYNLRKVCRDNDAQCSNLLQEFMRRRSIYPLQQWEDIKYGRHAEPPF